MKMILISKKKKRIIWRRLYKTNKYWRKRKKENIKFIGKEYEYGQIKFEGEFKNNTYYNGKG